jgi:hypothetical protein
MIAFGAVVTYMSGEGGGGPLTSRSSKGSRKPPAAGLHRIQIDGDWGLEELSEMFWSYTQVYAFLWRFSGKVKRQADTGVIVEQIGIGIYRSTGKGKPRPAYADYPFLGGHSSVNFFRKVVGELSIASRPRIIEMQYASPGFVELALIGTAALNVRRIVRNILGAFEEVELLYHRIYSRFHERKLMKISARREELALENEDLKMVRESCKDYGRLTGTEKEVEVLLEETRNPFASLKILTAFHRRIRLLAATQKDGKAKF